MKMNTRKIVLHIPHSSMNGIFDPQIGLWGVNQYFVNEYVNRLTDWYTDMLFSTKNESVIPVVFPYSRFVCDVERLEESPDMEGNGILYTRAGTFTRGTLSGATRKFLLNLREAHLLKLTNLLQPGDVLIDCHSFLQDDDNAPDICIGHNDDWSYNRRLVDGIIDSFNRSGYTVMINEPFSNSLTPSATQDYYSVMIEVNKRVYLKNGGRVISLINEPLKWTRWYGCLNKIYEMILKTDF